MYIIAFDNSKAGRAVTRLTPSLAITAYQCSSYITNAAIRPGSIEFIIISPGWKPWRRTLHKEKSERQKEMKTECMR